MNCSGPCHRRFYNDYIWYVVPLLFADRWILRTVPEAKFALGRHIWTLPPDRIHKQLKVRIRSRIKQLSLTIGNHIRLSMLILLFII